MGNITGDDRSVPIFRPIYDQSEDRIAVQSGREQITYGRLRADIDAMACWLLGNGLEPGARISLHVRNIGNPTYWDWIMHLGAMRAGLTHSTGSLPLPIARNGAFGRNQAVVGLLDQWKPTPGFSGKKLAFDPPSVAVPLADQIDVPNRSLDGLEAFAARILTTSGTTGVPKAVLWDSAMIAARVAQAGATGGIDGATNLFPQLGFPTTAGFRYPLAVWQIGGCVLLPATESDNEDFRSAVERSTLIVTSPFRLRAILHSVATGAEGKENRTLKLFGGRLPKMMRDQAVDRISGKVVVSYGSTETGSVATGDSSLIERHPGAVGFVLPGVTVQVVGPAGEPLPAGTEGVVRIRSDVMSFGYAGPAQPGVPSPFSEGWFHPGDLGVLFEDGMFAISGRVTETINVSGAKISAPALEAKLADLPGVEDICAVSMPLDEQDLLTIAVVGQGSINLVDLRAPIAARLVNGTRFTIVQVPEIPRNAMGKVMRGAFAAKLAAIFERKRQLQQDRNA